MQIAVVGAGVVGVCNAYFLAAQGHQVVLLERYGNVAQESSFGHAGLVSPGLAGPIATPGAPRRLMSWLSRPQTPVTIKPGVGPALWRWLRRGYDECQLERFAANKTRMQRLVAYSQSLLDQLRAHYQLHYEESRGVLQLFRSQQDWQMARTLLDAAAAGGVAAREVDIDAARSIEPALSCATPLAGALHFAQDESGNCALFTRQMRAICQDMGVQFMFDARVEALESEGSSVRLAVNGQKFAADAVVLAAGAGSLPLLSRLAPRLPLLAVNGFSASATIRDFDEAPLAAIHDETYQVAISRLGNRLRVAGTYELGKDDLGLSPTAIRTLVKCGEDWFPDAANYNTASFWCGASLCLPDGSPILGRLAPGIYLNIGHGNHGWAMASGAGKIVADMISGHAADIDLEGLTLARYG